MERPEAIVRFHALQSKTKQAPVIPWRLELDMKDHKMHSLLMTLVNCSVWQLIQIRLKPHHHNNPDLQTTCWNSASRNRQIFVLQNLEWSHFGERQCAMLCQCHFLTIMWTHLMCGDFTLGSWGEATAIFLQIVKDGENQPLCLRSHSRLQSGFAQWQQLRGERSTTQQDYGEFLRYFLGWICSRHVALTTSRQFLKATEVVIAEKSDAYSPNLLHSDLWWTWLLRNNFNMFWTNGIIQMACCRLLNKLHISYAFRFADFKMPTPLTALHSTLETFELFCPASSMPGSALQLSHIRLLHWCTTMAMPEVGIFNCVIANLDKHGDLKWLFHDDNCKPVGVDNFAWMVSFWCHTCLDDSWWQISSMETTTDIGTHPGTCIGQCPGSTTWVLRMATFMCLWWLELMKCILPGCCVLLHGIYTSSVIARCNFQIETWWSVRTFITILTIWHSMGNGGWCWFLIALFALWVLSFCWLLIALWCALGFQHWISTPFAWMVQ